MNGYHFDEIEAFLCSEESVEQNTDLFSLWIKDGDTYSPAQDLNIKKKINPGVYSIGEKNTLVKTNLSHDELIMPNGIISDILKEIDTFWNLKEEFKKYNLIHKRGLVLEGPPGSGKSSIVSLLLKQVIEKKGVVFTATAGYDLIKTIEYLQTVFRKIEPETPIVLVIEDIDKTFNKDEQSILLNFLDGKKSINHILTILTVNDSTKLSDTLLRPSRIDKRFEILAPDENARKEYFKTKNIDKKEIKQLVEKTEGLTFAQLKEVLISYVLFKHDLDETINNLKSIQEKRDYSVIEENCSL